MKNGFVFISLNYAPEIIGIGKYNSELAKGMLRIGLKPTIITTYPHYPEYTGRLNLRYKFETIDGVKVFRCPAFLFKRSSALKRIITYTSFSISIIPILVWMRISGFNKILSVAPTLLTAVPVAIIFRRKDLKHLHIQDFEVDLAVNLKIMKAGKALAFFVEKHLLKCYNSYSTISESMNERLKKKLPCSESQVIRNWASISYDYNLKNIHESSTTLPKDYILYSGNLGEKQGLEIIIDVAKRLNSFSFLICGGGSYRETLEQFVILEGLKNVSFLPLQEEASFIKILKNAKLHLVLSKSGMSSLVFPSKLTNIIAVGGVAIVSADEDSELERISLQHGCFAFIPAEDSSKLEQAIKKFMESQVKRDEISVNALAYSKAKLSKEKAIKKFAKLLR